MEILASVNENLSALQKRQSRSVGYNDKNLAISINPVGEQISASANKRLLAPAKRLPVPRSVRYGDGNLVTLIDPFGKRRSFPLDCCYSQDVRLLP